MKKLKTVISSISFLLACPFAFSSCWIETPPSAEPYVFSTNYTAEEHIQRIEERTADIFDADIYNDIVKDFTVDIVYSIYDNKPEYFVVEVEYTEYLFYPIRREESSILCEITHYKHIMGYIYKDDYYILEISYIWGGTEGNIVQDCMKIGQSPYSVFSDFTSKKYYGYIDDYTDENEYISSYGVYGIQVGENIVRIANTNCLDHEGCFEIHSEKLAQYSPEIDCIFPPRHMTIPTEKYAKYRRNGIMQTLRYHDDAVSKRPHC